MEARQMALQTFVPDSREYRCGTLCLEDMGLLGLSDAEREELLASFGHLRIKTPSVLIVDDDVELTWLLETRLRRALPGTEIRIANDPEKGIDLLVQEEFKLVILDWNLPGTSGAELLKRADQGTRSKNQRKVVVLSVDSEERCQFGKLEHFSHIGHVYKLQSLDGVIESIRNHYKDD